MMVVGVFRGRGRVLKRKNKWCISIGARTRMAGHGIPVRPSVCNNVVTTAAEELEKMHRGKMFVNEWPFLGACK